LFSQNTTLFSHSIGTCFRVTVHQADTRLSCR